MKHPLRKLIVLISLIALIAIPGPAIAASQGPCVSSDEMNYTSIEEGGLGINATGVHATIDPSTGDYFRLCTPNDGGAINAVAAEIGFKDKVNGAFFKVGVIKCVNGSYAWCDGYLRLIAEYKNQLWWGTYYVHAEPTAANLYSPNDYQVRYNSSTAKWEALFNGTVFFTQAVAGLTPANENGYFHYYGETFDGGDGLGNNAAGQRLAFTDMKYRLNNVWQPINAAADGSPCDVTTSQHVCINGPTNNSFSVYTVN